MPISQELKNRIEAVKAKRPRIFLDHICQHGFVTTEELRDLYGYNHPPRAARDAREQGFEIETFSIKGSDNRNMAAYRFPETTDGDQRKVRGRRAFRKSVKQHLTARDGEVCAVCGAQFPGRALQIDHRVPYEIQGDAVGEPSPEGLMLVCGSCNRAKSWSCEACENWKHLKSAATCETCFWGSPAAYTHVAMVDRRILTLVWDGSEVETYDRLKAIAIGKDMDLASYVKSVIRRRS